jgi:glutamate transport system permease protein
VPPDGDPSGGTSPLRITRGAAVQFLIDNFSLLWDAFLTTLSLSLLAGVLALVLGTLLAAARVSPIPPLRGLATFYVEIVRNTPLTVVFFFLIFGLPQIDFILGFFPGAVLSLGLYTAAFVCEAVRSGINAVSAGQAEASRAIGLTFGQSLREVVLPQAFRTVIPPLGNVFIAMVKNSSIAAGFAVSELSSLLPRLVNADAAQLTAVLLGVVVAYMLITVPLAFGVNRLERRVAILR